MHSICNCADLHMYVPIQNLFSPVRAQDCAGTFNGQRHSMLHLCAEPAEHRPVGLWERAQTCGDPQVARNCASTSSIQFCAFQHCCQDQGFHTAKYRSCSVQLLESMAAGQHCKRSHGGPLKEVGMEQQLLVFEASYRRYIFSPLSKADKREGNM